ncbi:MAG: GNAT family N-acetyltransferase [Anaerolineales bacterium]|nr:GNAT family N-acetyltransferase [Anaerolineales bacterium]
MTKWIERVTLLGKYVRLEPISEAHIDGLAEIGIGHDFWKFMLYGDMKTKEDFRFFVTDLLEREKAGTDLPFVAIHLASGRIAGATRYLNIMPKDRGLEVGGTWYGLDFQRTPVNTECKYLLFSHAFETLKCIRLQLKTDSLNVRSQTAIERIGAKKEGVLRNHMITPEGRYRDSVFYSILDTEWGEVKARLENFLQVSNK